MSNNSESSTEVPASVAGSWSVTIHGPTGPQETTLTLSHEGGTVSGTQSAMDQVEEIIDASYDSNTGDIAWFNKIKKPLPLTLKFGGVVEGNTISGHVNAAIMGKFPFTGTKHEG